MRILKSEFQRVSVALILGAFSAGFTPAVIASSTYDASAGIVVTLTDVNDLGGNTVTGGWNVMLEGFLEPSTSMSSTGDGIANASATSNVDFGSFVFLSIGALLYRQRCLMARQATAQQPPTQLQAYIFKTSAISRGKLSGSTSIMTSLQLQRP